MMYKMSLLKIYCRNLTLSWIMQNQPGSVWVGGLLLREPGVLEYPLVEYQPALGMGLTGGMEWVHCTWIYSRYPSHIKGQEALLKICFKKYSCNLVITLKCMHFLWTLSQSVLLLVQKSPHSDYTIVFWPLTFHWWIFSNIRSLILLITNSSKVPNFFPNIPLKFVLGPHFGAPLLGGSF